MLNDLKIKVCGMREPENIKAVAALRLDYMGFIFYEKSPRFVCENAFVQDLKSCMNIRKTGVFVNATMEYIQDAVSRFDLQAIQLHGNESPSFCSEIKCEGLEVIKAFQVDEEFDFFRLRDYEKTCDYYLLDTRTKNYGGSGKKFNWDLLKKYDNHKPLFLSGGITIDDVEDIRNLDNVNIYAVDINSRFEIEPALKDVTLIADFIQKIKK